MHGVVLGGLDGDFVRLLQYARCVYGASWRGGIAVYMPLMVYRKKFNGGIPTTSLMTHNLLLLLSSCMRRATVRYTVSLP